MTPAKPSFDNHTIYQTREGEITCIPDPEPLSEEERVSLIDLIRWRMGISLC